MNPQTPNDQPSASPEQTPGTEPIEQKATLRKPRKLWIIIGIVVALLVLSGIVRMLGNNGSGGNGTTASETFFFDMLSTAAQKTKVQQHTSFQYWDEGVATSAPPSVDQLSLSEYDTTAKKFNTLNAGVSAHRGVEVEKCLDDTPHRYAETGNDINSARTTLNNPAAKEAHADPNDPFNPCNVERSRRIGKFSDGIIPVGMTAEQVTSWLGYFKNRKLFTVKDEGQTEYKGGKARKISFIVNPELGNMSLFYAVRDGDTDQTDGLGFNWEENFGMQIGADLANPPSLTGYYLIDEKTKLPLYSNFVSATPKGKSAEQVPSFTQKATYLYPEQLTITKDTKLTILE